MYYCTWFKRRIVSKADLWSYLWLSLNPFISTINSNNLVLSTCFRKACPNPLLTWAPSINPGKSATVIWNKYYHKILSIRTGRSEQTMQTLIRLIPNGAVWSGSALFAISIASFRHITAFLSQFLSFLGQLQYFFFSVNFRILPEGREKQENDIFLPP